MIAEKPRTARWEKSIRGLFREGKICGKASMRMVERVRTAATAPI